MKKEETDLTEMQRFRNDHIKKLIKLEEWEEVTIRYNLGNDIQAKISKLVDYKLKAASLASKIADLTKEIKREYRVD